MQMAPLNASLLFTLFFLRCSLADMPMPRVTVCMSPTHARSNLNISQLDSASIDAAVEKGLAQMADRRSFLASHWDDRMILDAFLVIQGLTSMTRETTAIGFVHSLTNLQQNPRMGEVVGTQKKWLNAIRERGVSFVELQQKVGEDVLKRSRLQQLQREATGNWTQIPDAGVRITWLSQVELCFQPDFGSASSKHTEGQDQFLALSLRHNAENVEWIDCMTLDFHGRPSSEARYSEDEERSKNGVLVGELCPGQLGEVKAGLGRFSRTAGRCQSDARAEDGGSEFDCHSRCRMEMIRKVCKCTAPTLAYLANSTDIEKFPVCGYSACKMSTTLNLAESETSCGTKCLPACQQINYHVDHVSWKASRPELTQVSIQWRGRTGAFSAGS